MKKVFLLFAFTFGVISPQQININRIEQMPNLPSPYLMRDWKTVAFGYDSLVFDFTRTGEYLPLGKIRTNTVNYPAHNSFILHTVVGTPHTESGEAINCLPAIVSASLVGIDKSNQKGNNWVLMAEEWFNKRPSQNVYKNHPVDDSYNDWWYSMMPNVFFYQLYDLYPGTGDFSFQLESVADQWLRAVKAMGGSEAPWAAPYMNYRGFNLSNMTPYAANPPEPESAGSIAWILYNAFVDTGNEEYRIGAEQAMEFLSNWNSNPSYELQLPYGVYAAARMNAELGTNYNIEKMINWCFDIGLLRNWGAIVGTWDGIDVDGLIGESIINDYAFSMNTFQQIGALVPLVRYDERFARAIGKWVLNAANASRLFYPNYLPGFKQDSEEWAYEYDPNSYIAHEGMREEGPGGWSPYATGDAIAGGWGATNLSLYSSSHAGILGGIIDTTNVIGILKLDLLKTDYFRSEAYPTYLFFNPYQENKTITLELDQSSYDIYDMITNSFIKNGVSGSTELSINADEALIAVLIPSGSTIENTLNQRSANGVVIDYNTGAQVDNYAPRIKSIGLSNDLITTGSNVELFCTAFDQENGIIDYTWEVTGGTISGSGSDVNWFTPDTEGQYRISATVTDQGGKENNYSIIVDVVENFNNTPIIEELKASPRKINLGETTAISCTASDSDNDILTYEWSSASGNISGEGSVIEWTAPTIKGNYKIFCEVSDGNRGLAMDSILISVRDLSTNPTGNLICYYPFTQNVKDASGNDLNGTNNGAVFTSDRFESSNSALKFDGSDDNVIVQNDAKLNFMDGISINLWMIIDSFYEREQYPISHGNWEKRWKISISNKKLRWTIKTNAGIVDLDSETELNTDSLYNFTVTYSGSEMEIYINGNLDSFKDWGGNLAESNIDLSIGQSVPGNTSYNFDGILDDIRIYDYPLSLNEINNLYDISTNIYNDDIIIPTSLNLLQNYPNPFNPVTTIRYSIPEVVKSRKANVKGEKARENFDSEFSQSNVTLSIYDILGRKVTTLVNQKQKPGNYQIVWDASKQPSGIYFYQLKVDENTKTRKMIYLK